MDDDHARLYLGLMQKMPGKATEAVAMTPIELRVCRFRSFKEETVFKFPARPGLYFMFGDNQAEPRLEGNGAGKSSIWEALSCLFFNKTSRGLIAGDVANWEMGKGCWVQLTVEVGSLPVTWRIKRTWSPNTWVFDNGSGEWQDLAKDETNEVLTELRLKYDSYLQSIVMAQGEPMFLDLKADQKERLFSSVMGLDRWLERSKKAGKLSSDQDLVSRDLERKLAGIEGKLAQLTDIDYADQASGWEAVQKEQRHKGEEAFNQGCEMRRKATVALKDAETHEQQAREAYQEALGEVEKTREGLDKAKPLRDKASRVLHEIEVRSEIEHQRYESLCTSDVCPTCNQRIPAVALRKEQADLKKHLESSKAAEDHLAGQFVELDELLSEHQRKLAKQEAKLMDARANHAQAIARVSGARREVGFIDKDLDRIEDDLDRQERETNPFLALLANQKDAREDLQWQERRFTRELDASREGCELASYWVKWFKEIRLEQISEALTELEIEVNSCVNAAGLLDWELRFEVDRETAKGSLQRGFHVIVLSPHNSRPVPWEAWSGGESQRLRVAAQEGLANLIRARTGTPFDLEVWDEPTQWMSAQGVVDLLDSLSARAKSESRQIWIVDHRTLGYANFDGSVCALKTLDGSSFVQYSYEHALT